MRHLASLAALTLLCGGCDYTVLSTEVGEHVVYHYDADANQICGATVATADRFVEMIPAHYGLPHATNGPNIEYFWEVDGLIRNACPRDKRACVWFLLSGFTVFSGDPLCAHELAHTARGGHGLPPLINETFAWRWESALLSPNAPPNTELSFVNEAELRDHLERSSSDADVLRGFTWLIALEITYGPEKYGEFITELGESASAKDVEAAVQRVFGLSLAESVTLAASQPTLTVAEPACKLQGLPTLVWDGEPLVIDLEGARCGDDDIVNWGSGDAAWLFALEFPESGLWVDVSITMPAGSESSLGMMNLGPCPGDILYGSTVQTGRYAPTPLDAEPRSRPIGGRWVGNLVGGLAPDGSIIFPRVVFEESQP